MYIKEIQLNNFRIYKGVNHISLIPKDNKNIIIVSGQNGFGKTTFLMSLVWCLYGKNMGQVDAMYQKEISDKGNYTKYIADSMNRKAQEEGEKEFSVTMSFSNVNVQNVLCDVDVTRSYNIIKGTSDTVEVLISGQPQELIENLSSDNQKGEEIFIRDFILPIAIAKFFFFDAEKITSLAEINQTDQRRQLSQAYSEVLGIQKYEVLKDNLEDKLDEYRGKSANWEDKYKLNKLESDIKNTDLEIEKCESQIDELTVDITQKRHESEDISLKLVKAGDRMSGEELEKLRQEKSELENKKMQVQEELKGTFDIIPFALAGETLANVAEQIENEKMLTEQIYKQEDVKEKITRIRQDIEKEKQKLNFVPDIKTTDFYVNQIEILVKKYFYSDVPDIDGRLQTMHDFSTTQINEFNQLVSSTKNNFKSQFSKINTEYSSIKNQIDAINRKIRDAEINAQDGHIADLRNKRDNFNDEIDKKNQEIGSLNKKIEDLKEQLKKHKQDQTALRNKLDSCAQYSEKEQKAKQLIGTLQEFITQFKEQKKESLQTKMLNALTLLLHKKDFVLRVDVDITTSEDIDIVLFGKGNKEIDKSVLSMGERQLYASALLSSLVSESEIDFPVFIDSPMQKFDKQHAENIIKHFYPNVSKQVIIYPLLYKELTEDEYKLLQPNVCKTFLINNTSTDSSEFLETNLDALFTTYNKISNAN
ncbi:MAG: DNA sulfur modification protein DndD [Bacteroidales bacterium]|jgi:DNA sulfur modification protein DndD|nr:DNA sulfur modification protein DndD [Bacteroidales bacterium]